MTTPETLNARLDDIVTRILALLFGRRMDGIWQPVTLNGPALYLVDRTLRGVRARFAAVLRRIAQGTLRKPPTRNPSLVSRTAPSAPPRPRLQWPFRLRSTPGWLQTIIRPVHNLNGQIGFLHDLMRDPALHRLVAQAPQLRRILRPLCVMMGVEPPRLPEPAAARPSRPRFVLRQDPAPAPPPPLSPALTKTA